MLTNPPLHPSLRGQRTYIICPLACDLTNPLRAWSHQIQCHWHATDTLEIVHRGRLPSCRLGQGSGWFGPSLAYTVGPFCASVWVFHSSFTSPKGRSSLLLVPIHPPISPQDSPSQSLWKSLVGTFRFSHQGFTVR